ncbi:MAG: hypothetical protein IJM76_04730 [Lachnospiraceae bacterium]|nr:hypothetical protein [Lachnospiraceae bacterium]
MKALKDLYAKNGKKLYVVFVFVWIPLAFIAALLYSARSFSPAGMLAFIQNGFQNERGGTAVFFLRLLLFAAAGELALVLLSPFREAFLAFCFRFRYLIALAFVALAVLLNLNGSSLAAWNAHTGSRVPSDVVFGHPKTIRSDEWATFTPMIASQGFNAYRQMSPLFGGDTNTFIVYGLPSWNIFGILFRPFLNGFLLFGFERGLAFFWSARLAALFLAWFELLRKLTGDKRGLALIGAFIVSFSPIVQWWFAVNGLVEMLIFGPVALLSLDVMMRTEKTGYRLLSAFLLYISGCAFVMTFYPASAVALFLLYLVIAAAFIAGRIKDRTLSDRAKRRGFLLCLLGAVLMIGFTLGIILYQNIDTVQAVLNTDYPGRRVARGGREAYKLFSYWVSPYFPWKEFPRELGNECESATMLDLFPLGFLFAIFVMIRKKKADVFSIALMLLSLFVTVYATIRFPEWLAKLSLLSNSTAGRAIITYELANVIVMIRAMGAYEGKPKFALVIPAAFVYAAFVCFMSFSHYQAFLGKKTLVVSFALAAFLAGALLLYPRIRKLSAAVFIGAALLSGAFVNPLQYGSANIRNTALYAAVQEIRETEPEALWAVEGRDYPITNYLLMTGVRSFNATQVYPRFEVFGKFDPDGKDRSFYNRYAHVSVRLEDAGEETAFELKNPDLFVLHVSPETLYEKGNVSFLLTDRMLEELSAGDLRFELVKEADGHRIYRVLK